MTTKKSTSYTRNRNDLLRPEEVPQTPAADQAWDYAIIRGHFEATKGLTPAERQMLARIENRDEVHDHYGDVVSKHLDQVDTVVNRILNEDVVPDLPVDTDAPSADIDSGVARQLAAENLCPAALALQAAAEEFEATVAYAYHVTRMSYGELAKATGKSKSTLVGIVQRNRHLEVLAPNSTS